MWKIGLVGIDFNYSINIPKELTQKVLANNQFVSSPLKSDSCKFDSTLSKYMDESCIKDMMTGNPRIQRLLDKHGLKPNINTKELRNLAQNHLNDTKRVALGIYEALPPEVKLKIDKNNLAEAAILHDFGKVLIPDAILNKKGALNDKEKEIMQLHSELGYEMLLTQNIKPEILKLIKYHHQNAKNTGYPKIQDIYEHNEAAEVLKAADIYSALRENRSYKTSLSPQEALSVMSKQTDGMDKTVLSALEKYVNNNN